MPWCILARAHFLPHQADMPLNTRMKSCPDVIGDRTRSWLSRADDKSSASFRSPTSVSAALARMGAALGAAGNVKRHGSDRECRRPASPARRQCRARRCGRRRRPACRGRRRFRVRGRASWCNETEALRPGAAVPLAAGLASGQNQQSDAPAARRISPTPDRLGLRRRSHRVRRASAWPKGRAMPAANRPS